MCSVPVQHPFSYRNSLSVIPEFVFRKVALKGKWDHARTMTVGPRVREDVHGVHVVTPLVRENGSTVLVDRGFVSNEQLASGAYLKDGSEVEVIGMLRTSPKRNSFTPDNKPEEGIWYWTDVEAMTEYAGGEKAGAQPVFIEQIFGELLSNLCFNLIIQFLTRGTRWGGDVAD